jgi:2,4-dienoyl-CoA reductase-like NADH-dependent reductase (Old Yellow Enzyme family)/thioredoxin reductase
MHPKYPHVFSPIRLGPVSLANRFYQSPHVIPHTDRGAPTEDFIAYCVARVKGGCGLVMVSMSVPQRGRGVMPTPHPTKNIPALRSLADAVHDAGGKFIVELWYHWARPGQWAAFSPPAPSMAPSVVQFNLFEKRSSTHEMTRNEIRCMVDAFRQSAANLREAGFDGIMHHASHGAILEQFLSPYFNRRSDDYGGCLENRMRLLNETLQATREAVGEKMAVGMRFNCDELLSGGYDSKESFQILKRVTDSGLIDFVDLDVAVEPDQFHLGMPSVFVKPHVYRPYVEAVRGAAGKVPVLSVLGRLTSIADGEAALAAGVCDMVGAARALLAEPDLVNNAREGREDRSRTCIACNWCMAGVYDGAQTCTINPVSYRERAWSALSPAPLRCKVVIVGAGPAGLEAARVSALRGHDVVLLEARDRVGGALTLWASLPGRGFYQKAVDWWERELKRLAVRVELCTEASTVRILAEKPDAVVLATGARYSEGGRSNHRDFDIPGHERPFVSRPEDILLGHVRPAGKIVVLDGEGLHTGVGIAEMLANAGSKVEYLTPFFAPVSPRVAASLEVPFIMERLRSSAVAISPTTYIERIGDHELTVYDVYSKQVRMIEKVDAVVLSTGRLSVNQLEQELEGRVAQLFPVGDALAARMWATASYEGHKFARYIGEPNAPRSVADCYFDANDMS